MNTKTYLNNQVAREGDHVIAKDVTGKAVAGTLIHLQQGESRRGDGIVRMHNPSNVNAGNIPVTVSQCCTVEFAFECVEACLKAAREQHAEKQQNTESAQHIATVVTT